MSRSLLILFLIWGSTSQAQFSSMEFIEANFGKMPADQLAQITLDSIGREFDEEERIGYMEATYHVSQDGRLNIFQFIGEGCGAYCNPMYETVALQFENSENGISIESEIDFGFAVDSIFDIPASGMYLVFGTHSARPRSVEAIWGQNVALVQLDPPAILWETESTTSSVIDVDNPLAELWLNPETLEIFYRYHFYEEFPFREYLYSGTFEFADNTYHEVEYCMQLIR